MTRSPMPTQALNVPSKINTTAVLEERFYELIPWLTRETICILGERLECIRILVQF